MEVRHRVALPDKEGAAVLVLDTVRVPVPFQGPAREGEGEAEWVPDTVGVTVRVPVTESVGETVEVAQRVGLTEEEAHAVKQALAVKLTVTEGLPVAVTESVGLTEELKHCVGVGEMV